MPMNARLLRPRATAALVAVDADARTYINAVRIADGGQYMEAGVQRAIDAFVIGCKADGIWTAIKASCILMGARTLSGALTPLAGTAPTNVNFVSGDYDRETGLVGNGTNKYLNSNRDNATDGQDDHHIAAYVSTAATSAAGKYPVYIGAGSSDTGSAHIGRNPSNGVLFSRSRSATQDNAAAGTGAATGLVGISRSSSANYGRRISGSTSTITRTSQSPYAQNVLVFVTNFGAGPSLDSTTYSNGRVAFYSIGASLDLSLLDSRISTLYTAIGAAI